MERCVSYSKVTSTLHLIKTQRDCYNVTIFQYLPRPWYALCGSNPPIKNSSRVTWLAINQWECRIIPQHIIGCVMYHTYNTPLLERIYIPHDLYNLGMVWWAVEFQAGSVEEKKETYINRVSLWTSRKGGIVFAT